MQTLKHGVVVKVAGQNVIILTPDGQFCRIPHSGDVSVGAEVTWQERHSQRLRHGAARTAKVWTRWSTVAVAACLAVAAGVWQGNGGFQSFATSLGSPYALVGLDINPSVTFTVNRRLRVQSVRANDIDGQTVLKQLPQITGQEMQQAIAQVVQQAVTDHLLPASDSIVITGSSIQAKDARQVPGLVTKALQAVEHSLQKSGEAQSLHPKVFGVSIPASVFGAAQQAQIPPGQVASYLLAQHNGMTVGRVDAQTIRQIFGGYASPMTVADTQSKQQITALLNQLKRAGVLGNEASGTSGSSHPNHRGHGKGHGSPKDKGNVGKQSGVSIGGVGNNVLGVIGGTTGKGTGNSPSGTQTSGDGLNNSSGSVGNGSGSNELVGGNLGNVENSIGNTLANGFSNEVNNTFNVLTNDASNEQFITPRHGERGVFKH